MSRQSINHIVTPTIVDSESDLLRRKSNSDEKSTVDSSYQKINSNMHDFSRISVYPQSSANRQQSPGPIPDTGQQQASLQQGLHQNQRKVECYPFRATLKRQSPATAIPTRQDSLPGTEPGDSELVSVLERLESGAENDSASVTQETGSFGASPDTLASGAIGVPDIVVPELAVLNRSDAVNGAFTYNGSIARGGAAPGGFGVTRSFSSSLTGVTITPNAGTFDVAATFEHPITYQVRSGTGPSSQKDIASDTDSDITHSNYTTVVSDLTPDMSDLNGRPPRANFWAEDLTLRHELVHANDDNANGPGAMATVTTWLNGQVAASVAQVRTLLGRLPGRFAAALLAALSTPAGERRAYGDGAPLYRTRANSIKAKGDAGDYRGLSTGAKAAIGAVGGAAVGAGIGAAVGGPVGALVGAGAGALVGGLGSLLF